MVFIVAVVAPRTFSAMSLDHHHSFPALNDSNWDSWYIRMQAHLIRKGLWFNIIEVDSDPPEGTTDVAEWHEKQTKKRKKSKMEEARAEIVLKVEDLQLVHMRSLDPYEIMEALKRVHVACGLVTRMSLRRRCWNMAKKEDESMANWVSHVKALVWKLEAIGVEVTERIRFWHLQMVWTTLSNLSSSRSTLPLPINSRFSLRSIAWLTKKLVVATRSLVRFQRTLTWSRGSSKARVLVFVGVVVSPVTSRISVPRRRSLSRGSLVMVLRLVVRLIWFLVAVVIFRTWLIWVLVK